MLHPIALPGASLLFDAGWLPRTEADALFRVLLDDVPWEVHRIKVFGREVDSPRLSCWIGDPGAAYVYSGTHFEPLPWPAALAPLRERVGAATGEHFNSALANLYRDGHDAMGWHSDDERELGKHPVIASLSLGATRRFRLKARRGDAESFALDLPHGSLLVMAGDTQRNYRHALPRTTKPIGARINLTFRRVHPRGG